MAIITTYPDDSATTDDDKFLTSDSSGATKLTSGATLKSYILADGNVTTDTLADSAVTADKLAFGTIYRRQGNTTGDNSWFTPGTSNTDTSSTPVFIQAGSLAVNANPTALTFPVAFNKAPLVIVSTASSNTTNGFAQLNATPTTAGASIRVISTSNTVLTTEYVNWVAIGQ